MPTVTEETSVIVDQLIEAIMHFKNVAADKDDILIWMPEYIQKQLASNENYAYAQKMDGRLGFVKVVKFCGVDVLQGYENFVVVSVKDGSLNNVEPIKIKIP